eukprot:gene51616-38773_t
MAAATVPTGQRRSSIDSFPSASPQGAPGAAAARSSVATTNSTVKGRSTE